MASVFTISTPSLSAPDVVSAGPTAKPIGIYYDVAFVRFEDGGMASESQELQAAEQCITDARTSNPSGAIVVVFIHGWHHSARWDDEHFEQFRTMLKSLAAREAERYTPSGQAADRRVVGVYVGWNGDPVDSLLSSLGGPFTYASFWNRSKEAETIGRGDDLRHAIGSLIAATKDPLGLQQSLQPVESPLVLIGHSMGALILESAFLSLIEDPNRPLFRPSNDAPRPVETCAAGTRLAFPDVVLALNSAADSDVFRKIRDALTGQQFSKTVTSGGLRYAAPVLISVTSVTDHDTGRIWPLANGPWAGRKTDGHDASLFTHDFRLEQSNVPCLPRGSIDFGQNWHCMRPPKNLGVPMPAFPIDLPTGPRGGIPVQLVPHDRYLLTPRQPTQPHLGWVFQVPHQVIPDHNGIFNSVAASLTLGLIQLSGAVMSLATDLADTFEPLATT